MSLRLEPATPADAPRIHALAHRIWWAHYPGIVSDAQITYMLERGYSVPALEQQMAEGQQFFLLFDAASPLDALGYISLSPTETPGCYFIHKFYIDHAQQGRGIGRQVFALMLAHYPDAQEIRLFVNRLNYKSINFYFRVGFQILRCMETPIGEGFAMVDYEMVWRKAG
jgi:ribosomal protein S18 acetylase RimI-like enzyme